MLCLINKRKPLKVNKVLKSIFVKFAVLSRIIFIFYCFRLISFDRGFLFFAVRTVYYRICFLNTCLRNIKDLVIIFLFYMRKYKEKEKKKKFWRLLKVTGKKEKISNEE